MIRALLSLAMLLMAFDVPALTAYTLRNAVAAPRATDFHPPCQAGRCANYPGDNQVSGWFSTVDPLPANLDRRDIYPLLAGYAFSDGINRHASTSPDSRVQSFVVSTTATGDVVVERLWLVTWTSGGLPHRIGDRLNSLTLAGGFAVAQNNDACIDVTSPTGFGVETGINDACPLVKSDASSSVAQTNSCVVAGSSTCTPTMATWARQNLAAAPPPAVPAMSMSSLGLLALFVAVAAAMSLSAGTADSTDAK